MILPWHRVPDTLIGLLLRPAAFIHRVLRHDLNPARHSAVAGERERVELDHGFLAFGDEADVLVKTIA